MIQQSHFWYLFEENKNTKLKIYMHLHVQCSIIYISQSIERTQVYMNKETVMYIMEYYSAIKTNEILPFVTTWMDLEGLMLSEISQRKTNTIWSLTYGKKYIHTHI